MASIDVERLFRQFAIGEVKDVEKKIKTDIEKKKEDLRQLVGRRYQDIIEAADSISDMRQSSEKILDSLHCVQKSFSQLEALQNQLKTSRYKSSMSRFESSLTDVVLLSKLLNDLAGLIWDALDNNLCLDAAYLYNLADFVYRTIDMQNNANLDTRFVEMSWKIIRDQLVEIERTIKRTLIGVDQAEYDVELDALCAMLIMKNLGISDALSHFLSGKEAALKSIFDDKEISGRLQICNLFQYLQNTVCALAKLLDFDIPNAGHVIKSLKVRIRDLNDGLFQTDIFTDYLKVQSSRFVNSLPREIKEFRCHIRLNEVDCEVAKKMCNDWLSRCVKLCREMISECLPYFASIDTLCALKNSVQDIIIKHGNVCWTSICVRLFGKEISLWDVLIAEFLEKQLEELVLKEVGENMAHFENRIESYLSANITGRDGGSSNFLFCTNKRAKVPFQSSIERSMDLRLKSLGIPTELYQHVKELDQELQNVKIKTEDFYRASCENPPNQQDGAKFQMNSANLWKNLAFHLKNLIDKFICKISGDIRESYYANKHVFVAKICACFVDLLPAVKQILTLENCDQTFFTEITDRLKIVISQSYREALFKKMDESAKLYLLLELIPDANFWLENSLEWNSIEINDELDDGRKISSTISAPMSISPYLSSFLSDLCRYLCEVGPHIVSRECILQMNSALFARLLGFYDHLIKFPAPEDQIIVGNGFFGQKQAIQCIFELKFLDLLLDKKELPLDQKERNKERTNLDVQLCRLITKIESVVDPFDLDTIYPHLRRNVVKLMQKCQAIYGLLLTQESSSNQQRAFSALKIETNNQQTATALDPWQIFNVCDESSAHGRFRLLPVYDDSDRRHIDDVTTSSGVSRHTILAGALKKSDSFTPSVGQFSSIDMTRIPSLTSIYGKFSSSFFGHKED